MNNPPPAAPTEDQTINRGFALGVSIMARALSRAEYNRWGHRLVVKRRKLEHLKACVQKMETDLAEEEKEWKDRYTN